MPFTRSPIYKSSRPLASDYVQQIHTEVLRRPASVTVARTELHLTDWQRLDWFTYSRR